MSGREALVAELRLACESGRVASVLALLDPDVAALVDTAGDVIAPTEPLGGPDDVAAALLELCAGAELAERRVNGAPAIVVRRGTRVVGVVSADARRGRISHVWITRSPQKLRRWNP